MCQLAVTSFVTAMAMAKQFSWIQHSVLPGSTKYGVEGVTLTRSDEEGCVHELQAVPSSGHILVDDQ